MVGGRQSGGNVVGGGGSGPALTFDGGLYFDYWLRTASDGVARHWVGSAHATLYEAMEAPDVAATGTCEQAVLKLLSDNCAVLRAYRDGDAWVET